MINPTISKYVIVDVPEDITSKNEYQEDNAVYRGQGLRVMLRDKELIKAGRRRLYLKYTITGDRYYLSDRA